jgi:Ca2+-binding RTX toxin-like protein
MSFTVFRSKSVNLNNLHPSKRIIFIDSALERYSFLVSALDDKAQVTVLKGMGDRLLQITTALKKSQQQNHPIDTIHIFSHGSPGCLYLGNQSINLSNLENYAQQLKQCHLKEIFLYSCQVAAGQGAKFVEKLSELTGAKIAAATELIGNKNRGGTWDLSYTTGAMQHSISLPSSLLNNYQGILGTLTVTNLNDSGAGSLRNAIGSASAGDTIQFDSSLANSTITLTSGQIEIDKDLIIDGSNAADLTISGNQASRIFEATKTADGSAINLTIKNLSFADGKTTESGEAGAGGAILTSSHTTLTVENSVFKDNIAGGEGGGAIFSGWRSNTTVINSQFDNNDGTPDLKERGCGAIAIKSESELLVRDSRFTNNKGINGGAINSLLSKLTVETSTFINNDSTAGGSSNNGYGAAIYTDGASVNDGTSSGTIRISGSRFESNKGAGQGGALFLFMYPPDQTIVEDSTIINNRVSQNAKGDALGGGLRAGNGTLSISQTTFANNIANSQGGGLWVGPTTPTTITNSTFSGNQALKGASGNGTGVGGAISINTTEPTQIINSTINENYAEFMGGAFWGNAQNTTATNSIFSDNTGDNPWNIKHQTGEQLLDGGGNIEWPGPKTDAADDVTVTANITIADPKLGALQDNGNGQLTHALLAGSAAIDAGVNDGAPTTDQNGNTRPIDGDENGSAIVDSGAYEFPGSVPENSSDICGEILTPTITENSVENTINGTEFNDEVLGTDMAESFFALGGEDFFRGMSGNDNLFGGDGDDTLHGNRQNDFLDGEGGNDTIHGGKDNDGLFGNIGNDSLSGDLGNDTVLGGDGDDFLNGNIGDDFLDGGTGNDTLHGGENNDVLKGNIGTDSVFGDLGDDTVIGGDDDDFLNGNRGTDFLCAGLGNDTLHGGKDNDTLIGGNGNDLLSGDLGDDTLSGDAGSDTFVLQVDHGSDSILDFELGQDRLGLAEGLTFEQLTITVDGNNSVIQGADDRLLVTVNGVDLTTIASQDVFISLI